MEPDKRQIYFFVNKLTFSVTGQGMGQFHKIIRQVRKRTRLATEAKTGFKRGIMADQAQKDHFVRALIELGGSAGNGRNGGVIVSWQTLIK